MTNYNEPAENTKLNLAALGCDPQQIASSVLLLPFLSLEIFKTCFDQVDYEFHAEGFFSGFTARAGESQLTLVRTGTGSIRMMDAVLALKASPMQRIAFCGTCGGLQPDLAIGDLIMPTATHIIRDIEEVLEHNFTTPTLHPFQAPDDLKLQQHLTARHKPVHCGPVASIPSVFLLHRELAMFLSENRISGIDLESAYLHQVCAMLHLQPTVLLTVSDLPITLPLDQMNKDQKRVAKEIHIAHVKSLIEFLL